MKSFKLATLIVAISNMALSGTAARAGGGFFPGAPADEAIVCSADSPENRGPRIVDVITSPSGAEVILGTSGSLGFTYDRVGKIAMIRMHLDFLDKMYFIEEIGQEHPAYDSPFLEFHGIPGIESESLAGLKVDLNGARLGVNGTYRTNLVGNENTIEFLRGANGSLQARLKAKISYHFHQKELKVKEVDILTSCGPNNQK